MKNRKFSKKPMVVMASLVLLLCMTVGGSLAFLTTQTDPVKNTFTPAEVKITVTEKIDNGTKDEVKVKNIGDTTAYIRAAVVVTWQDEAGNIYGEKPIEGTDYTISSWTGLQAGGGWKKGSVDGFYYYTKPVDVEASTDELFTGCAPVAGKAPEGYSLAVEIIASAVQSLPTSAVKDVWVSGVSNVNAATGELTIK